ncbi:MAG: two-component system, cell cycle sensor histidine kinase and response regulator CckA [Gaiellaceae bacterium]|nr:two-component system, cell cycle sensor histidine kinase and response regulator CckA [Gaiellaceae bacterium]
MIMSIGAFRRQGKQLRLRLAQQQAIARLGELALTDIAGQELLDEACRSVAIELHTDFSGVLELVPGATEVLLQAGVGWPAEHIGVLRFPADPDWFPLMGEGPIIMGDAGSETRFEVSPILWTLGLTSCMATSIGSEGEMYGVLCVHTREQRDFSEHDVTFLDAVANILASALRRRAAELASESAYRVLQAVIEGADDDVFVKDIEGRFIVLNARAAKALGRSQEDVIGRTAHDVLPQAAADLVAEAHSRAVVRGTVETSELHVPFEDETRVYLTTIGPYFATDGTPLGTFGFARDVTTHNARIDELARSEESLRLAQEGARTGTWDVDLLAGVTMWSDGLRAIYGLGPDVPAGFDQFLELVHRDDREMVVQFVSEAYAHGVPFEFECRIIRPDGELRWIMARASVRSNDAGTPARVLGVAVDITERKLAEEDLLRRDETLRLAQVAGHLGAWDWDLEAGTLTWTEGMYAIYGLDPASFSVTPDDVGDCTHPDDNAALAAEIVRVFGSGEPHFECAFRALRPSGETRWLVNRGTVLRGADGMPQRMIGVTLDETERMRSQDERDQLETRLLQAEKLEAVGQLAGGVAHDFNNLLVAMRGFGELALGNLARGEAGAEANIEAVLVAADRAAALTRQLLAFGRRQVLDPQVLDLNDVVRETAELLERLIGDNVELVTGIGDEPVIVKADRGQLEQVVMNLAVNARDAMPGGGTLTIRVARANPERTFALLSVTDDGAGIDSATAAHIFEPFFTTKGEEGTGLGLATVHGIVAQSGGQIVVESAAGAGTTFMVYLPLCADDRVEEAAAPDGVAPEGSEAILLVEDDPAVRMIVATMLSAHGYTIVSAADGEEAVKCFEAAEHPFGLVVSDLNLRGVDGQETISRIRKLEPSTKVLYMSGYTDDPIIRGGGLGDRTSFIPKPFSGDALATRVRELLDGVRAA